MNWDLGNYGLLRQPIRHPAQQGSEDLLQCTYIKINYVPQVIHLGDKVIAVLI